MYDWIYSHLINTWMFPVVVVGVCIIKLRTLKKMPLKNSLLKNYRLIEMHLFSSGRDLFRTLYFFLCPLLTIIPNLICIKHNKTVGFYYTKPE
jgi:hypothetical protein